MDTKKEFNISITGQAFVLLAEKAMFWKDEQMLIISDVHLGKSRTFQKAWDRPSKFVKRR